MNGKLPREKFMGKVDSGNRFDETLAEGRPGQ